MVSRLPAEPPVLSGFQYVRPLGTGGFADVFLFEQDMPRRMVAVKVLLRDIVDDALVQMFHAEADAMAKLSAHPSILTIYQASISADGRPYLVMEYCPSSFTSRYRNETLSLEEVLHLGVKMGSALETAHQHGMLHRDIKPSNILVTQFGAPVLSDFGIVAATKQNVPTNMVAMSVPWSAPEIVAERETGSIASEVWSFGATLYTLLAGKSPFEKPGRGMNQREKLKQRIQQAKYTPMQRTDIPASLEEILRTSMQRDPRQRQQSVLELTEQLQHTQKSLGVTVTPLEIAVNDWEPQRTTVADTEARGPVRSTVSYVSKRVPHAERARTASDMSGRSTTGPRGSFNVSTGKIVALIAGTALVTAAGVFLAMNLLGSGV